MKNYKRILQYLYTSVIENFIIQTADFKSNPPIIIYQMGKVGSTTIYRSLKNLGLKNRVYHIHFLSQRGVELAIKNHKKAGIRFVPHLSLSRGLSKKLIKDPTLRWKIVTLVREPIGFEVSNYFQNYQKSKLKNLDLTDEKNMETISAYLERKLSAYDPSKAYVENWFEKEIKTVTGVDVFNHPFDQDAGYSIIRGDNADILIMRLESLNQVFNPALKLFLGMDRDISMIRKNVGADKIYSSLYAKVKDKIKLSENVCERIYDSKFFSHFYGKKMKSQFLKKWSH